MPNLPGPGDKQYPGNEGQPAGFPETSPYIPPGTGSDYGGADVAALLANPTLLIPGLPQPDQYGYTPSIDIAPGAPTTPLPGSAATPDVPGFLDNPVGFVTSLGGAFFRTRRVTRATKLTRELLRLGEIGLRRVLIHGIGGGFAPPAQPPPVVGS